MIDVFTSVRADLTDAWLTALDAQGGLGIVGQEAILSTAESRNRRLAVAEPTDSARHAPEHRPQWRGTRSGL